MSTDYVYDEKKYYDNSKKISELLKRQYINSYQDNTWIPVAQYEPRINSYYNLAINLNGITGYCNTYSYSLINKLEDKISYELGEVDKLMQITYAENIAYYINNSAIASTIISYGFSYNINYLDWQFL